jgi:uncharacterized membrane protein
MSESKLALINNYESTFVLDVSKMSRLLNVIEERFKDLGKGIVRLFKIETRKGKSFSASNVEAILGHDNAIKNPITSCTIKFQDNNELNLCRIKFDRSDSQISVQIYSLNQKWSNDLFAEVEEQIERTFVQNFIYKIKHQRLSEILVLLATALLFLALFVSMFIMPTSDSKKLQRNYLTASDIDLLQETSKNISTQSQKIDFLFDLHLRQLENLKKSHQGIDSKFFKQIGEFFDFKMILVFLPIIVVFLCIIYLFTRCYPGSIFLWGDYKEYYKTIIEKRKFVWNTIIIALITGVLGNLFVFGIARYI